MKAMSLLWLIILIGCGDDKPSSPQSTPTPGDTTPPFVTITSPANGAHTTGYLIRITATASDAGGNVTVYVFPDGGYGQKMWSTISTQYWVDWQPGTGSHSLIARGTDPSGNIAWSQTVNFTHTQ